MAERLSMHDAERMLFGSTEATRERREEKARLLLIVAPQEETPRPQQQVSRENWKRFLARRHN